jgi:hypothetical protein
MREYGLLIRHEISYGTDYVKVMLAAREGDRDGPLGCSSDGESSYDSKVPKHMHGLMLDGLSMNGFVNEWGSDVSFIGHEIEFRDVFSIDIPKAARMLKTLKRVTARIRKDDAREPGDRFMSLAKALKLSFAVEDRGKTNNNGERWRWMTISEGRDRYRTLIEDTITEVKKRKGIAA